MLLRNDFLKNNKSLFLRVIISLMVGTILVVLLNYKAVSSINCNSSQKKITSAEMLTNIETKDCVEIHGEIDKGNIFNSTDSSIVLAPLKNYSNSVLVLIDNNKIDSSSKTFSGRAENISDKTLSKLNEVPEVQVSDNISSNLDITLDSALVNELVTKSVIEFNKNTLIINTFELAPFSRLNVFLFFLELFLLSLAFFEISTFITSKLSSKPK